MCSGCSHKIPLAQCLVPLPGAPLWLGASLTITSDCFGYKGKLAPPFCVLWPRANKQTMTRWGKRPRRPPPILQKAWGDFIIWVKAPKQHWDMYTLTTIKQSRVHKLVWSYKQVQLWWSKQASECMDDSNMFSTAAQKHHITVSQQLWEGKRDRQIYRIDFTFNLRQNKKKKKKKRRRK